MVSLSAMSPQLSQYVDRLRCFCRSYGRPIARVANRPGFPGTVPELACGVPCPGLGRFFPGIFHKVLQYDTIVIIIIYLLKSTEQEDAHIINTRTRAGQERHRKLALKGLHFVHKKEKTKHTRYKNNYDYA